MLVLQQLPEMLALEMTSSQKPRITKISLPFVSVASVNWWLDLNDNNNAQQEQQKE